MDVGEASFRGWFNIFFLLGSCNSVYTFLFRSKILLLLEDFLLAPVAFKTLHISLQYFQFHSNIFKLLYIILIYLNNNPFHICILWSNQSLSWIFQRFWRFVTSPKEELSGAKLTQTSGKSRFTENRSGTVNYLFRLEKVFLNGM